MPKACKEVCPFCGLQTLSVLKACVGDLAKQAQHEVFQVFHFSGEGAQVLVSLATADCSLIKHVAW